MRMKGDTGVRQIDFKRLNSDIAEEITKYAYTIVDPEEIKYQSKSFAYCKIEPNFNRYSG